MKIKIIKSGPWQIGANLVTFKEGQILKIGEEIPDKIAEDMLRCDYAIPDQLLKIETKDLVEEKKAEADIESMDKDDLEVYARENLSIELDKRKSIGTLLAIVKAAIEEKNNE